MIRFLYYRGLPILTLLLLQATLRAQSPTTIKTYQKTFKTYMYSDPNPIPVVEKIYPYYRFDGFTDSSVVKAWKVIELENAYIKVMILPEIGGKIWAAWDKASGKSFIYNNHVVKFRDVAMRGPWTSGGIEPNYGIIGHTPNCATAVDSKTVQNADGSGSCFVGTFDKLTQTSWTIEINLPKDKAYFTTRSYWHNSTELEQPYYTWMNTGMPSAGNLEFSFPGNKYLGHEGEYASWPLNTTNQKKISWYNENNFGSYKSYHVFGQVTDFFAAYYHDQDFGMGHYSPQDEKPGKKIWIWGLSRQGMIWEQLLTDQDGQYVEIQSGRLFNQSAEGSSFTPFKHRGFAPYTSDEWKEYWFPIKHTKGVTKANPYGAFNYKQEGEYVKWSFCPLQSFQDTMKVMMDGSVKNKYYRFTPLQSVHDSVKVSGTLSNLEFNIGTKFLYSTTVDRDTITRPVNSPKDFDWNSSYGHYLQGKEWLRDRQYEKAEAQTNQSLAIYPHFIPALSLMAELKYRNMEYAKALDYARKGLSIDTYDPAANFIYGLINKQLDAYTDAIDGFNIASASMEYRSAAYTELAKIYMVKSRIVQALPYAEKALESDPKNTSALEIIATIHRITKQSNAFLSDLNQLERINPLNHFIASEKYLQSPTESNRQALKKGITQEAHEEIYISLADRYLNLGRAQDALHIINAGPLKSESLYWKAYLQALLGDEDYKSTLKTADGASCLLQFPYRNTTDNVFRFAIAHTDSWKPKYYYGLLLWSKGRKDEAKELFSRCGETSFAPFYAAYANLEPAMHDHYLQKAMTLDANEWRYGKQLIQSYLAENKNNEALQLATNLHEHFPSSDVISFLLSKAYIENKQYEAAYNMLMSKRFLPNEGSTEGRNLYTDATLLHAIELMQENKYGKALEFVEKASLWPENLGVGKPYDEDIDRRIEQFCKALCLVKLNRPDEADKTLNEITMIPVKQENPLLLINAWALKMTGKNGKDIIDHWVSDDKDFTNAKAWCASVYAESQNFQPLEWNHPASNLLRSLANYMRYTR